MATFLLSISPIYLSVIIVTLLCIFFPFEGLGGGVPFSSVFVSSEELRTKGHKVSLD